MSLFFLRISQESFLLRIKRHWTAAASNLHKKLHFTSHSCKSSPLSLSTLLLPSCCVFNHFFIIMLFRDFVKFSLFKSRFVVVVPSFNFFFFHARFVNLLEAATCYTVSYQCETVITWHSRLLSLNSSTKLWHWNFLCTWVFLLHFFADCDKRCRKIFARL